MSIRVSTPPSTLYPQTMPFGVPHGQTNGPVRCSNISGGGLHPGQITPECQSFSTGKARFFPVSDGVFELEKAFLYR